MKILFWTDGFWPRIGGIETQSLQFIEGMQERGHEFVVLAQKDGSDSKEDEIYQGIRIKRFNFNELFLKRDLKRLRPIEAYLEWIIREFQPDIVHVNTCVGWSAFAFLLFRKRFHVPLVATIHSPFFYGNQENSFIEKISSTVNRICCVSHWVFRETEKLIPLSIEKLRLIYNGLPMSIVEPAPLCFSPPTLLLLGRFTSEKGFDTAIHAFSLLKKGGSNAKLLIAGEGVELQALESLVSELGLGDSVQFMGGVPRENVFHVINQATVVVVPSYFESFGLVALEAMQMGRPVIASRVGGMQEVISDGETGVLVSPQDPLALCKAIEELLKSIEKAKEMGMKGRKRAIENFTIGQNVTQYEDLYKELR